MKSTTQISAQLSGNFEQRSSSPPLVIYQIWIDLNTFISAARKLT